MSVELCLSYLLRFFKFSRTNEQPLPPFFTRKIDLPLMISFFISIQSIENEQGQAWEEGIASIRSPPIYGRQLSKYHFSYIMRNTVFGCLLNYPWSLSHYRYEAVYRTWSVRISGLWSKMFVELSKFGSEFLSETDKWFGDALSEIRGETLHRDEE